MTTCSKKPNDIEPWQNWLGLLALLAVLLMMIFLPSCGVCKPKTEKETVIEYRDRVVRDTTTVEIPYEVEKIVTLDTLSKLENRWAKSEAKVSKGLLHHSLESKPQIIEVPVEVHVTDTLYKEASTITVVQEVEKPLSWWQKFKMEGFWIALVISLILLFFLIKPFKLK